ncbi:hypothetical protein M422DRAFT_257412 [Sphaerobolus stellatus SS14]|uniref:Uncharacterized protein n=1 Tax=Sphaerobolus stellatus (strain SS14) TaxID=990650 RepID=A0A0C9U9P8_SPHS4|nr:hypothetical protein M422DRAFT_257412 [Sphaerobolus stellatus SS14]
MPTPESTYTTKIHPTYANFYGALLIAILTNTFMYGVSLSMVLQYFKMQAKGDTRLLKVAILLLITLATLETIFTGHQLYDTFIIETGDSALIHDRIPLQLGASQENMHAFILQPSLLNYSLRAESGQSARVFTVEHGL